MGNPAGNKNPPEGNGPRISRLTFKHENAYKMKNKPDPALLQTS
jgi:hypothetical protein